MNNAFQTGTELRVVALQWLIEKNAETKAQGVLALREKPDWHIDLTRQLVPSGQLPGRPEKPVLVPPQSVEKRSMRTVEGRAALIHALCHIEFNAINLALDAIWRFADMPEQYYRDWLKVAVEEADHFMRLKKHLNLLGFDYGDFPGHDSLWEMVERTQEDVLARMALVPRTLEARGLDACPALRNKLAQVGDDEAAKILDIILRDEIGHVAIGNTWFNWICVLRELDPITIFSRLCEKYNAPTLKPPLNWEARKRAGFSDVELAYLNGDFIERS